MIATSHVIIGGAIGIAVGTVTKNPAAGLAVGIVSHLLCDLIPHLDGPLIPPVDDQQEIVWTKGFYTFAIADSLLAFFITLYFWYSKDHLNFSSMLAWTAFGAYLPDFVDNFPMWARQVHHILGFKQFHWLHLKIHETWQKYFPMQHYWPLGIITQVVIVLPCLWYLAN